MHVLVSVICDYNVPPLKRDHYKKILMGFVRALGKTYTGTPIEETAHIEQPLYKGGVLRR